MQSQQFSFLWGLTGVFFLGYLKWCGADFLFSHSLTRCWYLRPLFPFGQYSFSVLHRNCHDSRLYSCYIIVQGAAELPVVHKVGTANHNFKNGYSSMLTGIWISSTCQISVSAFSWQHHTALWGSSGLDVPGAKTNTLNELDYFKITRQNVKTASQTETVVTIFPT